MENRAECALKPRGHACDQGRTNDAYNDVFTQPTQNLAALRVGGYPVLALVSIYRPRAAASSHRYVPDRKVPCCHSIPKCMDGQLHSSISAAHGNARERPSPGGRDAMRLGALLRLGRGPGGDTLKVR